MHALHPLLGCDLSLVYTIRPSPRQKNDITSQAANDTEIRGRIVRCSSPLMASSSPSPAYSGGPSSTTLPPRHEQQFGPSRTNPDTTVSWRTTDGGLEGRGPPVPKSRIERQSADRSRRDPFSDQTSGPPPPVILPISSEGLRPLATWDMASPARFSGDRGNGFDRTMLSHRGGEDGLYNKMRRDKDQARVSEHQPPPATAFNATSLRPRGPRASGPADDVQMRRLRTGADLGWKRQSWMQAQKAA